MFAQVVPAPSPGVGVGVICLQEGEGVEYVPPQDQDALPSSMVCAKLSTPCSS